jgi:hypothetical protein
MSYQAIGRGSAANDGTGDDLRTGAGKVNANFTELYTKLGDGSSLSSDSFVTLTGTETLTNKTLTAPTLNGTIGGTAAAMTITALTTEGISNATGELEITAANQVVEIQGGGSNSGAITLNCEVNTHGQKIIAQPHSAAVTNVLTLPAGGDAELVSTVATQTLTNKTLTSPTITGTGAIAGTFTGDITGNVTGNIDGIVGGTTPAAVTGTTVTANTTFNLPAYADAAALAGIASPAAGMLAYQTDTNKAVVYNGTSWNDLY